MDLKAKAAEFGIQTDFVDAYGHLRPVEPATLKAILDIVPPPAAHPLVPSPLVAQFGQPLSLPISEQAALPVTWIIGREDKHAKESARGRFDQRPFTHSVQFEPGVYRLDVADAQQTHDKATLVVSPQRTFGGDFDRAWVLAIQLYSLRSASNWGIGDFSDLAAMIRIGADAGAAGIGLNPLHALFDDHPADCSPYSPNSRLFLNPIYIDVTRAPGFPSGFLEEHAHVLDALRHSHIVNYSRVAELKWQALRAAFAQFAAHGSAADQAEFDRFREARGETLLRFSCFEHLRRQHQGPWWDWPVEWQKPDTERLHQLRHGSDSAEISYFEFLQWLADRQLRHSVELAAELKMAVGLYLDVAVGVKGDGFDSWSAQSAISRHASVGAPPDILNTAGQDWGLAGYTPTGLEQALFEPFRDMLEASMRYAGAIRLDHVMGLQRLYLVPVGFSPKEGAYVRMPFEALLAVIAIESQKHKCIVVGEDLGTVPEGFRERLAECGIWSYRVMMFERHNDGSFLRADQYAVNALVTFSTHDLPTFAGWKAGRDLVVKLGLGIDPGETEQQRAEALAAFGAIIHHAPADVSFDDVADFLNRTPSRILSISIEDLQHVLDQPNVPGTINEHPNWRRKLPVSVEAFAANITGLRKRLDVRQSGA